MRNPSVIGKDTGVRVSYITRTKMYGELGWLQDAIGLLRFRCKSKKKNNEYETRLLQGPYTLPKATTKSKYSLNDGMEGKWDGTLARNKRHSVSHLQNFLFFFNQ